MQRSFKSIFLIVFFLSLGILVLGEWLINQSTTLAHVIGWAFVASFIASLIGIVTQKGDSAH